MIRTSRLLLIVLAAALVAPPTAAAAISIKKASLSSGTMSIEGQGARAGATVTVTSPESTASGRSDSKGEFRFSASGYRSSTCRATVADGATSATATFSGCTASTPPPPPPPSSTAAPTSLSLSPASLSQVGTLSIAGVTFPANTPTPLDFAVASSDPAHAQVPSSVHVDRFSDPSNPVASFTVTYASAVAASTAVTISVSGGGATRSAVLTLQPPPPPQITPDQPTLGPGFVGSDFTTTSESTTTLTLGPNALGPVRWQIVAGALPAGLQLVNPFPAISPNKQVFVSIAGTPTTVQTSTFTVRGTDANGLTAQRTYSITINPPIGLAITPEQWPPLTVGSFGNLWIDGSGGVRPYRWAVTAGQLPPGMTLIQDNPDGPLVRVGGTPTAAGTFMWTLRLTDAQGASVSRSLSVTVS